MDLKTIYFKLDKFEDKLHKIAEVLSVTFLATAFVAIFVQVLYRYALSKIIRLPLHFTEELSRFCLFWVIYLMLPTTIKDGLESSNTFFAERLPDKFKTYLWIVVKIIVLFVILVTAKYSYIVIKTNWFYSSPAMGLPGVFMYGGVPVGMVLTLLRILIETIGVIIGEVKPFRIDADKGGVV